jgi:hypothetical protein
LAHRALFFAHRHRIAAAEAERLLKEAGQDEERAAQLLAELQERKLSGDS